MNSKRPYCLILAISPTFFLLPFFCFMKPITIFSFLILRTIYPIGPAVNLTTSSVCSIWCLPTFRNHHHNAGYCLVSALHNFSSPRNHNYGPMFWFSFIENRHGWALRWGWTLVFFPE